MSTGMPTGVSVGNSALTAIRGWQAQDDRVLSGLSSSRTRRAGRSDVPKRLIDAK